MFNIFLHFFIVNILNKMLYIFDVLILFVHTESFKLFLTYEY